MAGLFAPIDELHEIIAKFAIIITIVLSLILGNRPQKVAGLVLLADAFGLAVIYMLLERRAGVHLVDLKSLLILGAYVAMTLRWPDRWIVLLTGLQLFAVFIRAAAYVDQDVMNQVTALLLNGAGWLMIGTLAVVTVVEIITRFDGSSLSQPEGH